MKLSLSIGRNIPNSTSTLGVDEIITETARVLALEGYTAYETHGMWAGEREDSVRIEIYPNDKRHADLIIDRIPALSAALRQNCIAVEIQHPETLFIGAATA